MAFVKTIEAAEALRLASDNGDTFSWSNSYNYDAADTVLFLRNDSAARNLHIDMVLVSGDTATQITIHMPVDIAATPDVVGVNLNADSAKVADASAEEDEALNAQANVIAELFIAANSVQIIGFEGSVILGHEDCIAVDFVTVGTMGCVTIIGHYEDML